MENSNAIIFNDLDISSVIDTKVSHNDLVDLLVQKKQNNLSIELKESNEEIELLERKQNNLKSKWNKAMSGLFKEYTDEYLNKLKDIFPNLKTTSDIEILGFNHRGDHDRDLDYTKYSYNSYNKHITGYDRNSYNIIGDSYKIIWNKLTFKAKFKAHLEESRKKLEAKNFSYEFQVKKKGNTPAFKKIYDAYRILAIEEAGMLKVHSMIEAKIEELKENQTKIKAHVTEQILSTSDIGQQILERLDSPSNLLESPGK